MQVVHLGSYCKKEHFERWKNVQVCTFNRRMALTKQLDALRMIGKACNKLKTVKVTFFIDFILFITFISHIFLWRVKSIIIEVSSINEGFTIDIWNFKIQNNLFFMASFTRRDDK